jgi:hypothetical protein
MLQIEVSLIDDARVVIYSFIVLATVITIVKIFIVLATELATDPTVWLVKVQ